MYTVHLTNNSSNPEWTRAGARGVRIPHDFKRSPLQIMTDTPFGSGTWLHIGLRLNTDSNNDVGTGGVKIELSEPPKYFITFCSGPESWAEFTPRSCSHVIKTWTVTKTSSSVKIECDLETVVVYQFASSNRESCLEHWSKNSGAFQFRRPSEDGGDTASKMYRKKPDTKTGMAEEIYIIQID